MSDALAPPVVADPPISPLRRARGVAMTAGLIMTPLMIAAGFWVDRAELREIAAGVPQALAGAALRSTIAPESGQR